MNHNVGKIIKDIGRHQLDGNKIRIIIDKIKDKNLDHRLSKFYKFVSNKLYRRQRDEWKLYIPNNVSNNLIAEIHRMYGHLGPKRCVKMLQEHFTFDRMLKKVKAYVQTCDTCQKCKDTNNRMLFGGTRAVIPSARGDLVSADYYGPLPTGAGGVKYLLVMVDNFTKFVKLFTLRTATTTTTLRRVRNYCEEFERPKVIMTDNGTQFTSKKWVNGLKEMNIQPKYTAIRNPSANLAKRINRQLGNLFRILVHDQHSKWSRYIRMIETCINEVYHETIEINPHEAHLGKRPTRAWEKWLDKEVIDVKGSLNSNIFVKIKKKREKQQNAATKIKRSRNS